MLAPHQILTAAQMQAAEQALIGGGETVSSLMERAGAGAAEYVWRIAAGRPVTVLCGPGNNGGDGYVIARVLAERGLAVSVVAPLEPKTEAAQVARSAWGGEPVAAAQGGVFVDCLFGTGLGRPLADDLAALVCRLAADHEHSVAIDLPSGVDSDSGAMLNQGLHACQATIALGSWKRAHWLMPACADMGTRKLVDIGIGPVESAAQLAGSPRLSAPLADAHKYTRGLLAVIGGVMPGAAMLAARAALHGGAGYVKLLAEHKSPMTPDELVVTDAPIDDALADKRIDAVLVGPGLGRDDAARARLEQALGRGGALVLDGDALVLLEPDMLADRRAPAILTPHAGELATLCDRFGIADGDKCARVEALAQASGATIVAKGPDTLVASPGHPLTFMGAASSWLSTAGTGDVLAGLVASRLAHGDAPQEAAITGSALHTEAARLAAPALSAGTLIDYIPAAYASFL